MTTQELLKLRADHLKNQHGIEFYEYQESLSDRIIYALLHNLRITKDATPEQIDKLEQYEIAAEISRQAGKTLGVGHTAEFILTYLPYLFDVRLRIGIFATQLDQAKISYGILRNGIRKARAMTLITKEQEQFIKEEENARKLVLPDGSYVIVGPISKISQIEGETFDLIIIDEAQLADDQIVQHRIWPMGKTTNAPRIYIGKSGTQKCHFLDLTRRKDAIRFDFPKVAKIRRQLYDKTKDARHLIYEKSVNEDIRKYGVEEDFIQREYFLKWQLGTGQFTTEEELESLVDEDRSQTHSDKQNPCYVGIDTAKHPDSTVVTVVRVRDGKKELINWLELQGENYKNQFEIIVDFLDRYKVEAIAIDSTGQGVFMADWFSQDTQWADEHSGLYPVPFNSKSKDGLYRNLKVGIKDSLTRLPKLSTKTGERFKQQMLDLQQEYKFQGFLAVSHPDDVNAHDDYPDSWALAEWAYAKSNESADEVTLVTVETKERKAVKDDEGRTLYDWPDEED